MVIRWPYKTTGDERMSKTIGEWVWYIYLRVGLVVTVAVTGIMMHLGIKGLVREDLGGSVYLTWGLTILTYGVMAWIIYGLMGPQETKEDGKHIERDVSRNDT